MTLKLFENKGLVRGKRSPNRRTGWSGHGPVSKDTAPWLETVLQKLDWISHIQKGFMQHNISHISFKWSNLNAYHVLLKNETHSSNTHRPLFPLFTASSHMHPPGWTQQRCSGAGPAPAWSCSFCSRRDSQSGWAHHHGSSGGCGGTGLNGRLFRRGHTCSASDRGFACDCAGTCSWCRVCYKSHTWDMEIKLACRLEENRRKQTITYDDWCGRSSVS